jgi:hypothetical protein
MSSLSAIVLVCVARLLGLLCRCVKVGIRCIGRFPHLAGNCALSKGQERHEPKGDEENIALDPVSRVLMTSS